MGGSRGRVKICWLERQSKVFRPDLRAVEQAQNSYTLAKDNICGNIGRTRDHKLPCPVHPSGASTLWKFQKLLYNQFDPLIDPNRSSRIRGFDKVKNGRAVSDSQS